MKFTFESGMAAVLDERFGKKFKDGHCFLAITPTVSGSAAFVNFSSIKDYTKDSYKEIVLDKGDHPYIDKATCVPMSFANIMNAEELARQINELPYTVVYERMSIDLHAKILKTVLESDFTSEDVKEFITMNFGEKIHTIVKNCVFYTT